MRFIELTDQRSGCKVSIRIERISSIEDGEVVCVTVDGGTFYVRESYADIIAALKRVIGDDL